MNIRLNFGFCVTVIPTPDVTVLSRATAADLQVLLYVGGCLQRGGTQIAEPKDIADELGLTESQIHAALAFWRGAGMMDIQEEGTPSARKRKDSKVASSESTDTLAAETEENTAKVTVEKPRVTVHRPARKNELPNYTAEEMAALLESTPHTADCIHECEQIWGKLFNTHETNIILGLVDYLGLEWDYVITLLAHCAESAKRGGSKKSLHYVEQTAFGYYDEGITDMPTLQERIRRSERLAETEGQLRALFGMGERSLTPNEKKCFSSWLYDFKYDMPIIRKAYDITVDAKGEPNIKYMNSILANWNSDDLRTIEAIDASMAEFKEKQSRRAPKNGRSKLPDPLPGGSFETDDFFDSAVNKTFSD